MAKYDHVILLISYITAIAASKEPTRPIPYICLLCWENVNFDRSLYFPFKSNVLPNLRSFHIMKTEMCICQLFTE